MHNVFKGIVIGILGFIIWFMTSVVGGFLEGMGGERDPLIFSLMFLGFFVMVGGPVVYIVILPIRGWWRGRRR